MTTQQARTTQATYRALVLTGKGGLERYRKDRSPFKADLEQLFELLERRRIQPKIAARLPLLAGVQAQRMLEEGGVVGKIVLLRDA
jgi:NADPH:quinone reductase